MRNPAPLVLVVLLAAVAAFLAFGTKAPERPAPPPQVETKEIPAAGEPVETEKSDTAVATAEPRPWPHESSDIAADPEAIFGALDNGMRYVIYPNGEPPQRVSLRLHIAAGSLMEADDQRGLAHFLEHMVFNGTKHYTAAELVPRMQRLGIAFGAHANAYTSFDETVYMLDLPDLSGDTMNLAFTVMRDFGDGALLDADEIDKERGVILSEKVSRDSVGYRMMEKQFAEILPDSLVTKRFPIGKDEVISNAPRERFVDFYTRYYTPERMTFIVVGDIDPQAMEERIEATFGSMGNPAEPGENPDLGKVTEPEGLEPSVFTDKELDSSDVSLVLVRPYEVKVDSRELRASRMPLAIAHAMMDRRFERISKEKDSPVASANTSRYDLFNQSEIGSIDITAADDRWQDVVPVLEREFRRVREFGFTEAELAEAKSNILNAHEQAVKQKDTRKSEGIAMGFVGTINDEKVFSTPETDLEIAREALDGITAETCHEAFKEFWDAAGFHLILTTKEAPENSGRELAALFEESRGTPVEPPAARAIVPFGYTDFGKPGKVASRNEISDLGITQLVLSNHVRVNLKPTDFEKGRIRMSARIGSGKLTQPADSPMLDAFATAICEGGGLGKHSIDELQQILAGRNVGCSLGIGEDAFTLGGSTTPADFQLQCRLMCASLTDPGWRDEALWQFQKAVPMIYQQLKHTAAGPQGEMNAWLHGGDARYSIAPMNQLAGYRIADARKWLEPELSKGSMELSIVGDFEIDAILPDLLATFGALPARAKAPAPHDKARQVDFPNAPAIKEFTYDSKIPQGIAITIWKTGGLRDNVKEFRRLNILGEILGDRLREEIREKLGASYSPYASPDGSDALDNFGYMASRSVGKPEDIQKLIDTMRDLADKLATAGADEDELDRALKPTLGMLKKSLRDNGYWLNTVMAKCQEEPDRLELARTRDQDYQSITLAEINALAKKYLAAENAMAVTIRPAEE